jgi:hypothetical protein
MSTIDRSSGPGSIPCASWEVIGLERGPLSLVSTIDRSSGPGSIPGASWEVIGLERGPLSLVSTIEELLGRNSSDSDPENQEYGRRDPSRSLRDTLCPQKLALTSLTSGGLSVGIDHSWIETGGLFFVFACFVW